MRELRAGLWHWQAPHWTPGERRPQEVSSYAIDDGKRLLLFDPPAVPDEFARARTGAHDRPRGRAPGDTQPTVGVQRSRRANGALAVTVAFGG